MLVTEFKDRTGLNPTEREYRAIEEIYTKHKQQKDEFCAQWKKMPEEMRNAVVEAMLVEMDVKEKYRKESEEWKRITNDHAETVQNTVIELLDDDSDCKAVYSLVPMRKIVLYKARGHHDFNARDIDWIEQHTKDF